MRASPATADGRRRFRPLSTVTVVLVAGTLALLGLGAVIWNLVDTREPVPPVQIDP
jgi:hypothetical protein